MARKAKAAVTGAAREPLRLAVTGCQTLVGRGILASLDELGPVDRVVVFDLQPPDAADPRIEYHQVDLTRPGVDAELVEVLADRGVDTFLHAAFLWDPVRDSHWAHDLESVGTDWVLAAVQAAGVRKLVVTSSVLLYGVSHRSPVPVREDAPLDAERTIPPFRDKVAAERTVARFAAAHPEVCVTVLRSAVALGPDVDRVVPRYLRRRLVPVLAGFDPLVQLVHPDDVLAAYRTCLREAHPGAYNVTTSDAIALSDVLRLGGRTPVPIPHPVAGWLASALWASGVADAHPSYLGLLRFAAIADGAKARDAFAFVPRRTTVDTVREFYRRVDETP
jgi:UDP-glucose 4-epimerase